MFQNKINSMLEAMQGMFFIFKLYFLSQIFQLGMAAVPRYVIRLVLISGVPRSQAENIHIPVFKAPGCPRVLYDI